MIKNYTDLVSHIENINSLLLQTGQNFEFQVVKNKWRKLELSAYFFRGADENIEIELKKNLSAKQTFKVISEIVSTPDWSIYA